MTIFLCSDIRICVCGCVYLCIHICMCICVYEYIYIYRYIYKYICINICRYIYRTSLQTCTSPVLQPWNIVPTTRTSPAIAEIPRPTGLRLKRAGWRAVIVLAGLGAASSGPAPREPNLWLNQGIWLKLHRDP